MAFASHALSPRDTLTGATSAPRQSFVARIFRALHEARLRQAEREIALYLTRTGGKFTDAAEREIEQRFLGRNN